MTAQYYAQFKIIVVPHGHLFSRPLSSKKIESEEKKNENIDMNDGLEKCGFIRINNRSDFSVFLNNLCVGLPFKFIQAPSVSHGYVGVFHKRGFHHLHYKGDFETSDCATYALVTFIQEQ